MIISWSACKQAQPMVADIPGRLINRDIFINPWRRKEKVVVVMGATGTGKSRLSIDLATRFPAEIVNSDKMQVYKGLDIVTNKVTEEECLGVPHHLLGTIDPFSNFSAIDFRHHASLSVESIVAKGRLPIIAGGSNSYIEALVDHDVKFRSKYECCFIWVDVSLEILNSFVSDRVDRMVEAGLVEEVRRIFDPEADYSQGIRRAIGVPELDSYLRSEGIADHKTCTMLLKAAIDKIKDNNCKLAAIQQMKIKRLQSLWGGNMHYIDATEVFRKRGIGTGDAAWEKLVAGPGAMFVRKFLRSACPVSTIAPPPPTASVMNRGGPMTAVAATTRTH